MAATCMASPTARWCSLSRRHGFDVARIRGRQWLLESPVNVEITGGAVPNNMGITVRTNASLVVVYDIKPAIDAI